MEKKTNAKVAAPKPNGKKAAAKKTATPEKAKAAEKKIEKQAKGPLGKTSGMTRTGWFMDFFLTHKGKIPADDKILMIAVKEFGEGNVGKGTVFTPTQMRGWFNCFCKRGSRGLSKKDMIVETAEVTT